MQKGHAAAHSMGGWLVACVCEHFPERMVSAIFGGAETPFA